VSVFRNVQHLTFALSVCVDGFTVFSVYCSTYVVRTQAVDLSTDVQRISHIPIMTAAYITLLLTLVACAGALESPLRAFIKELGDDAIEGLMSDLLPMLHPQAPGDR
jgi:hypothetical protein